MNRISTLFLFLAIPVLLPAQIILFQGKVVDDRTNQPLEGVLVHTDYNEAHTDKDGLFEMEMAMDVRQVVFHFILDGNELRTLDYQVKSPDVQDLGLIKVQHVNNESSELLAKEDQIPTIVISENDLDGGDVNSQDISGLLTASRDVFVSATSFTFGPARFRIRGVGAENTTVLLNGVPVNDLESGQVYWSSWGGLNDVLRYRQTDIGLGAMEYAMGGIGGGTAIDTRATTQRKQLRASYAISNRTYRNRLMLTWSSGLLKNGWAVTLSGSRRWAQEGYVEGTFYDAWSYFASIDKLIGKKHQLNLTAFGAPIKRGKSSGSIQELYDLAGSNYYNSYWGYQNGEKRNSRVANIHQPLFILRHDWTLGGKTTLTTAASYKFGRNGSTAIDWYNARDPRPDYYRYLPSYVVDPAQKLQVEEAFKNDENVRQLNWDYMYNVNYGSVETVENANGIDGNTVTGLRSKYIVEERRYDSKEFNFNTVLEHFLTDRITLNGGLGYRVYQGDYFKVVDDLLGGEFYLDIDRFAETDFPDNPDAKQNDLNTPNRILKVGDRFGYDYNPNIRKGFVWGQSVFSYPKVDFFLGGELSTTTFWRHGDVVNGRFPDNSYGDSEKQKFLNYSAKAGLTYKISNIHYLFANALVQTRAPFFRNSYISPRTRDQAADNLVNEKIQSGEAGYLLRSPRVKARASAYWAQFRDQTRTISFYNDETIVGDNTEDLIDLGFVNFTLSGVDARHIGTELALEYKVNSALTLNAVAALGQYVYTSRPTATIVNDNDPNIAIRDRVIYQKNYRIPGTPQTAYTAGINYSGKKYWFANLNVNYFDNVWIDFNPNRRTEDAINDIEQGSDAWNNILAQEKAAPAWTVDFFGGKSFKIKDMFLYLNVGVSNILNNTDFVTGGYEQLRFDFATQDPNQFPSRYFYYFGRTYFINLSWRL
ncbi:MAG: TonB-dependent receptor plug domain-containing protein [Lewinellaceae bacterium]|nr:TonB-dependent receptor plug domain-containing protein [Lewinellaceae bacterium]